MHDKAGDGSRSPTYRKMGLNFETIWGIYLYGIFPLSPIGPILQIEGPRIHACADICKEMSLAMINDLRAVSEAKM